MILQSKGRYAIRAVYDIAVNSKDKPVSIKDISKRNDISLLYLEKIFSALKKNKILKSVRGKKGGYLLNYKQEDITVGMILRAVEDDLNYKECLQNNNCEFKEECPTNYILNELKVSIDNVIENITIKTLVMRNESKNFIDLKESLK